MLHLNCTSLSQSESSNFCHFRRYFLDETPGIIIRNYSYGFSPHVQDSFVIVHPYDRLWRPLTYLYVASCFRFSAHVGHLMTLPAGRNLDFSVRYCSYPSVMPLTTTSFSSIIYFTRSAQTQKMLTSICVQINMFRKMKYSVQASWILKTLVITEHSGQSIDIFGVFAS